MREESLVTAVHDCPDVSRVQAASTFPPLHSFVTARFLQLLRQAHLLLHKPSICAVLLQKTTPFPVSCEEPCCESPLLLKSVQLRSGGVHCA